MKYLYKILIVVSLFIFSNNTFPQKIDLNKILEPALLNLKKDYSLLQNNTIKFDNIKIDFNEETISISMNKITEGIPYRENVVTMLYDSIKSLLPEPFNEYKISIYSGKYKIEDLVPNIYRENLKLDKARMPQKKINNTTIVKNISKLNHPTNGLNGKHIALWHSHGYYYECSKNIWQWQRPYLFGVTEDTYTMSYTIPYLIPMLENAGAYIFTPRERDVQTNEVIVDNDTSSLLSKYKEFNDSKAKWIYGNTEGFALRRDIYLDGENPFKHGTYRYCKTEKKGNSYAEWIPYIPEKGDYAVYVSYKTVENSTTDAHYTVYHLGGKTDFIINQKMGGGTWIYLGTFTFDKGSFNGRVVLTNDSKENGNILTADAVRFGGGMGNIARSKEPSTSKSKKKEVLVEPTISNMPRYKEGAKYWLQWAGYDQEMYVFQQNSDYKDDYVSRSRWVNALCGGSYQYPQIEGKNIPIDLAFGFHSDAGLVNNDSVIGTMGIYMTDTNEGLYKNGQRRITSRDLTDILLTQICNDLNIQYRDSWTRRKLNDASYFEAREPEVPTFLLELLSHQNFTDMKYGLDPNFRFTVARAVYKAILKYLAFQYNYNYVVQPLPVSHVFTEFYNKKQDSVYISWQDTPDSLETTAQAKKYIIYTSTDNEGFDNGTMTTEHHIVLPIEKNKIYRYKITAVNEGGESLPSEILSVCNTGNNNNIALIVNGFRRVAAPDYFETDYTAGFLYNSDMGMSYGYNLSYVGQQYDYVKKSKYKTNIVAGLGSCSNEYETMLIAGNTFDYPYIHGKSLKEAGFSFISASKDAITDKLIRPNKYKILDFILGEEKETISGKEKKYHIFDNETIEVLSEYLNNKGSLILTGSYIASDVWTRDSICNDDEIYFVEQMLKYTYDEREYNTNGKLSNFFSMQKEFQNNYTFSIKLNKEIYSVLAPDAIKPVNGSTEIFNFSDNRFASIGYKGKYNLYISSIPFETIENEENRNTLMKEIINYFKPKW